LVLLIKSGDRDTLMHYAKLCVDNMYQRICGYGAPITTISLVQGEALGGGFRNPRVLERHCRRAALRMGLPEILFNLFPGNGAYSLLARRVGVRRAEEMILSGRVYNCRGNARGGACRRARGRRRRRSGVQDYIRRKRAAPQRLAGRVQLPPAFPPVSYEELLNIANLLVSAALRLEEKDLKLMSRLARSQSKRVPGGAAAMPEAGATMEQEQYATA